MKLEDVPVEIMFYRSCRCGNVSRDFDQYAPCHYCGSKLDFTKFKTEPILWSLDRARTRLTQQNRNDA